MKRIIVLAAVALSLFGVGFERHIQKDGFHIDITTQKPLTTGSNQFIIHFKNNAIKNLKMKFYMPAMPGMPYMKVIPHITKKDDHTFNAKARFPMAGTWQLLLYITTQSGKKSKIHSSLSF